MTDMLAASPTTQAFQLSNMPPYIFPLKYRVSDAGIFRIKKVFDEQTNKVTKEILLPLSRTPLKIVEMLTNPDTGEVFYDVEFLGKIVTVPASEITTKKGIMQHLAGQGLITAEKWAGGLAEFIAETIACNTLPEKLIYNRFGWKADGNFVLGEVRFRPDGISEKITIQNPNEQTNAIRACGTIQGWIDAISGLMKHDSQRFKIYNGIVPTILRIVNESNYSLNDFGETCEGKTLTTLCAMSMYGGPYKLIYSGDATKVGMERLAFQFCDMPINLDDTQNTNRENLIKIIYMIGNGQGKVRGAKLGGLQDVLSWQTVGLFTGEAPIITDHSFAGLDMRLIEISKGLGKSDNEAVEKFEAGIKDNYGVFAPLLIEYLIKNKNNVIELHKRSYKIINDVKGKYAMNPAISGMAGRLAGIFASILTAGYIFEELYGQIGGEKKNPEPIVIAIFERLIKTKEFETYTRKGLDHILSWIAANRSNFLEDGERATVYTKDDSYKLKYKIFGNITPQYYDILPTELRNELERAKFSLERLVADFKDAGLLECDKGKSQKTVKLEGEPTKVYRFRRETIDTADADSEKESK